MWRWCVLSLDECFYHIFFYWRVLREVSWCLKIHLKWIYAHLYDYKHFKVLQYLLSMKNDYKKVKLILFLYIFSLFLIWIHFNVTIIGIFLWRPPKLRSNFTWPLLFCTFKERGGNKTIYFRGKIRWVLIF